MRGSQCACCGVYVRVPNMRGIAPVHEHVNAVVVGEPIDLIGIEKS